MAYIVGLTGGIGSGKSTIAEYFSALGVPIIDADVVSRQIVEKGSPLLDKIAQHFGNTILTKRGELNRERLRQIVFSQPEEKEWLNQLLHPAIRMEMLNQLKHVNYPYVLWVVPLLIENQLTEYCQRILVIDVLPHIQLERAIKRDKNREEIIKNIMNAQINRETRLSYASDIIENNLPLVENEINLKQQVKSLHQTYLTLAKEKK